MKKEETNKLKFYLFPFLFLANTKTSKQQQTTTNTLLFRSSYRRRKIISLKKNIFSLTLSNIIVIVII